MAEKAFDKKTGTGLMFRETAGALECPCGSLVFSVHRVEFEDYEDGFVAQCQECENIIVITKD